MRTMFCLTLALAATGSWAAEVYRSVAADGTVTYSDRPSSSNSEQVVVATTPPASGAGTAAARPSAERAEAPAEPATEVVRREPTPAERAEERARNCATAQERVGRYNVSHRLFRTLPNGEREYLNDAEIDEARARAAADVESWCD